MNLPPAVILAGGRATRMGGGDKGLLPLGDRFLIEEVIDRIAPQVSSIALNANGEPSRFAQFGLPVLADSVDGFVGPLAGVLAGLDWAAENGHANIVSVAADTPFFPRDLVAQLIASTKMEGVGISLAATIDPVKGQLRHPTFGLWPVSLRDDLRTALQGGLRKVVIWTERHGAASTVFDQSGVDPFFNVNTPEDLALAQRMNSQGIA
jgi:molybdopterin-guanine dinucleotide biosynthesis protein A